MATVRCRHILSLGTHSRVKATLSSSFSPTPPLWRPKPFKRTLSDARPLKASVSGILSGARIYNPMLPIGKHTRRIPVRPSGWETNKETEVLPLTLLGQTMPKIYGLILDIFELPKNITAEQQEGIVFNLRRGLAKTLEQFPIMTGVLEWNEENGEIGVRKNRDSEVGFEVRYMDGENDEFPTFDQLESRHASAPFVSMFFHEH